MSRSIGLAALAMALRAPSLIAQGAPSTSLPAVAGDPKDVASPEAIIAALYDVLSGTQTQQRNWDRFRSLFIAGGRLMPTNVDVQGNTRLRVLTADEYAKVVDPQLKGEGFFEREISHTTDTFGAIMHVFSTYESRHALSDPQPFGRGINSIELFNDGTRWWIISVLWDRERPNNPIPAKYLPGTRKP